MSLHSHVHLHQYFKNKEIDELYASVSIASLAEGLIALFVPIYLYQLGYQITSILFYFLLLSLAFVIFSYKGAKIVSKIGVKHAMLFSTPFLILYYLGLRYIELSTVIFYVLPFLVAMRAVLFNYGFHLDFIESSEKAKRGREVSMISILSQLGAVVSPLFGGFIILYLGYPMLFVIGATFLLIATVPLFLSKEKYEKVKFSGKRVFKDIFVKKNRPMLVSFTGYAVESIIGRTLWPVFLIIMLLTVEKVGAVATVTMLLSLGIVYGMGFITDKFDKIKLLKIGTLLHFFGWVSRIFATTFNKVLFIDTYKNFSEKTVQIPWSTYSYDIAMKQDYFQFVVQREITYNIARIVLFPILIGIFYFDVYPFYVSFLVAALFSLFYVFMKDQKN